MPIPGLFQLSIPQTDWQEALSVSVQSTGKIIVTGTINFNSTGTIWNPGATQWQDNAHFLPYVVRLNTDGSLDTTFGVNGLFRLDFPGVMNLDVEATACHILPDDSILLPFVYFNGPPSGPVISSLNGILKLTKDGVLDLTFGANLDGTRNFSGVTLCINKYGYVANLQVWTQSDGSIILCGSQAVPTLDVQISKLDVHGVISTTFGNLGSKFVLGTSVDCPCLGSLVQPDDKIVYCFQYGNFGGAQQFGLGRLDSGGLTEVGWGNFNTGGLKPVNITLLDFGLGGTATPLGGVMLEPGTGNIIVSGFVKTDSTHLQLAIARFKADHGLLDTTFGATSGYTLVQVGTSPFNYDNTTCNSMFYDHSGNIIIVGSVGNLGNLGSFYHQATSYNFIARFTSSGILDTTFGSGNGYIIYNGDGSNAQIAYGSCIQADGKFLVAAHGHGADYPTGGALLMVFRTLSDGTLDTSFGGQYHWPASPTNYKVTDSRIGTRAGSRQLQLT